MAIIPFKSPSGLTAPPLSICVHLGKQDWLRGAAGERQKSVQCGEEEGDTLASPQQTGGVCRGCRQTHGTQGRLEPEKVQMNLPCLVSVSVSSAVPSRGNELREPSPQLAVVAVQGREPRSEAVCMGLSLNPAARRKALA